MRNFILFAILFFSHSIVYGQSALGIRGTKITDNKLYIKTQESGVYSVFVRPDNEAGDDPIEGNQNFSMDSRHTNVYMKWLNPLRFEYKWSDSTFDDESDLAVKNFMTALVGAFGAPVANLNKDKTASAAALARYGLGAPNPLVPTELQHPPNGFNSLELTNLYLMLRLHNPALNPAEVSSINSLTTSIIVLDNLNAEKIPEALKGSFDQLFKVKTANELNTTLPSVKSDLANLETTTFKPIENSTKNIPLLLPNLTLTDKLLEGFVKNTITKFVEQAVGNLTNNRALVTKFNGIVKLMEQSIATPGDVSIVAPGTVTEYYKQRNVRLADGKGLHTNLSVISKKYDTNTYEYKSDGETNKGTLQFRKYDPVVVFGSAGVFWATTNLKGYGVDKDLKVIEDDIEKDNFVSAAFLNFGFGASRFLSPILQLGIDPTKKRPFFLAGGGFAIPGARFAITAGGVWTFQPTLNELQKGQTIESTTDLEKDITYKFSGEPKGWYLGIQYNF